MLVACYVLVHGTDMVINTYEIQQIHVTFYLVIIHINDLVVIKSVVGA